MKQIRIALIASSLLILSACATVDRAPEMALHELERGLVATQDPRISPNDQARLDRIAKDFRSRLTRGDQRRSILALSEVAQTGPTALACWSVGASAATGPGSTSLRA